MACCAPPLPSPYDLESPLLSAVEAGGRYHISVLRKHDRESEKKCPLSSQLGGLELLARPHRDHILQVPGVQSLTFSVLCPHQQHQQPPQPVRNAVQPLPASLQP